MTNSLLTLIFISPFIFAVFLANLAEQNRNLHVLQYVYLLLLNSFLFIAGLSSLGVGLLPKSIVSSSVGAAYQGINWPLMGIELMAGTGLAMLLLLPRARQLATHLFNIDGQSVVHATALSLTATALGLNLFQMNLNSVLLTPQGQQMIQKAGGETYLDILIFPMLTLLVTALFGVGCSRAARGPMWSSVWAGRPPRCDSWRWVWVSLWCCWGYRLAPIGCGARWIP